jgi:hypothetical protein
MLDMKVEKYIKIPSYSWLPTGTYYKKYGDLEFLFVEMWRIWAIFFPQKNP